MTALSHPYFKIWDKNNQFYAQVNEPGVYGLTWSDGKKSVISEKEGRTEQPVSGAWNLAFDTAWGGPAEVSVDSLKSWTEFTEEGIKYYSGTAVYKKEFEFSKTNLKNKRAILDLGNLHELATVRLNGETIGNVWISPFTLDVTNELTEGTNHLEIEVVNLWPNRLILDGRLPEDKRLTHTNITKFNAGNAEKYLRISGLLGPVRIVLTSTVDVRQEE